MADTAVQTQPIETAIATLETEKKSRTELAPVDQGRVEEIKGTLDITSSTSILNFGTGPEREMARFADDVLKQVMSKDMGAGVRDKLTEIKLIAKGLSADKLQNEGGFFSRLFFSLKREIAKFEDRFTSAKGQIDAIARELEDKIQEINLGLVVLDKLFDQNQQNFKDLTLHIVAGHELLEHYRTDVLPAAQAEAEAKKDDPDAMLVAQKARDLKAAVDRLDRKLLNMEKSKAIAFAQMPTIRQVQQTGIMLIEELKMALAHAIPAWKSTMIIHVEQLKQAHGLQTLQAMTDFTNQQLQNMAEQLDQNAVAVHKQSQRGIADVEAITNTIDSLIGTIDKIDTLEIEARKAREESRSRLAKAEADLREAQSQVVREIEGPA